MKNMKVVITHQRKLNKKMKKTNSIIALMKKNINKKWFLIKLKALAMLLQVGEVRIDCLMTYHPN